MGNSNVLAGNHLQQPRDSNNNTCSAFSQTIPSSHLGPILNILAGLLEEQCKQLVAAMHVDFLVGDTFLILYYI
ncbi:unnamed protein product [Prunus armeniaca]|uniref:Uncharacterized protein n=1 Tax=Prunus armeniaca TaxID=36596 RepID=A0A6J5VVR5_PRUAR|nr:unnamed protein product [Prunus armeniaca]